MKMSAKEGARIARKQDGMPRFRERRLFERRMAGWESPRCAFAMDPAFAGKTTVAIGQQFFARDVVADEVHE